VRRALLRGVLSAQIHAAIDGEPLVLETPLEFEIKPGALRVLLPPSGAQGGVQ
jgi:diacylglycerol kinase family enzyme